MYVVRARPCTQSVHGRGRSCTRAVNTAVYRVHDRVGVPCTRPWTHYVHGHYVHYVHSLYTAVGGRVQTVHGRPRPCTNCVHGRTRAMHMVRPCPEHGRVRSRYEAKHGRARGRTRPCTYRIHGRARAVYRVHGHLHGRLYGPCARPCTYHAHGRAWSVHDSNTARKRPCTADGHGRVYGPCTRPCTVYMHVFVTCVYGRRRPCTDCLRSMYMVRS